MVEFASDVVIQGFADTRQAVHAKAHLYGSPAAIQTAFSHLVGKLQNAGTSVVQNGGSFVRAARASMAR